MFNPGFKLFHLSYYMWRNVLSDWFMVMWRDEVLNHWDLEYLETGTQRLGQRPSLPRAEQLEVVKVRASMHFCSWERSIYIYIETLSTMCLHRFLPPVHPWSLILFLLRPFGRCPKHGRYVLLNMEAGGRTQQIHDVAGGMSKVPFHKSSFAKADN